MVVSSTHNTCMYIHVYLLYYDRKDHLRLDALNSFVTVNVSLLRNLQRIKKEQGNTRPCKSS